MGAWKGKSGDFKLPPASKRPEDRGAGARPPCVRILASRRTKNISSPTRSREKGEVARSCRRGSARPAADRSERKPPHLLRRSSRWGSNRDAKARARPWRGTAAAHALVRRFCRLSAVCRPGGLGGCSVSTGPNSCRPTALTIWGAASVARWTEIRSFFAAWRGVGPEAPAHTLRASGLFRRGGIRSWLTADGFRPPHSQPRAQPIGAGVF